MNARIVPAARGARWLVEGWRAFRAAPLGWLLLVFAYLFITQLAALVPLVGSAGAAIAIPAFTVGFMAVTRRALEGGVLEMRLLFEGFRADLRRQLALGAVYLGCGMAVLGVTMLADFDGTLRGVLGGERPSEPPSPAALLAPLAAFGAAYMPVMMLFWFAPALCAWHATGVVKALFFSFFACLMNWRAFLVYGAVAAGALLAANALLMAAVMLGSAAPSRQQMLSFAFPLLLLLLPTLFASFYASYRDVFGTAETEGAGAAV
jgi:hypothetical protein